MGHGHAHTAVERLEEEPRRGLGSVLAVVVGIIAVLTIIAMVVLWPDSSKIPRSANPYSQEGVSTIDATVTKVAPFDCGSGGEGPDGQQSLKGDCANVTASTADGTATFQLDAGRYRAGIEDGDKISLIKLQPQGQEASYEFLDFKRGFPLTALAVVFALLVVAVARWRGLFAIVGIGVTLLALFKFVLPAILSGESPLVATVVGSTGIMIVVLYLAHGVSIRTTSALFGTLFGIACTAAIGWGATGWTSLNGVGSEDDQTLLASAPDLHMQAVVAASMVIAGLGVLNDVTVTQASAVWEMRALRPTARAGELFASAMRIGRDHIASSVYTLVFAYAGSAMTILLLITAYQRGLAEMATTEELAQEIVRTLVGAIGLVLAVPVTTVIAVVLAPPAEDEPLPEPSSTAGGSHRA